MTRLTTVRMTAILAVAAAVGAMTPLARAAVIARQGFENSPNDNYAYSFTTTGTSAQAAVLSSASSFPTSSPVASGSNGFLSYRVTTTTIDFGKVNLTGRTDAQVSFRLAALASSLSNGPDNAPDSVKVFLDSGTDSFASSPATATFSATPDLTVTGNGNSNWSYTGGAAVASNANPAITLFKPASANTTGTARTTDGYSTVLLNLPAGTNYFSMRVVLATDNTSEAWAIDDVTVSATPEPAALSVLGIAGVLGLRRRRAGR